MKRAKIIVRTPYPTSDEVAGWFGMTAKERAEIDEAVLAQVRHVRRRTANAPMKKSFFQRISWNSALLPGG